MTNAFRVDDATRQLAGYRSFQTEPVTSHPTLSLTQPGSRLLGSLAVRKMRISRSISSPPATFREVRSLENTRKIFRRKKVIVFRSYLYNIGCQGNIKMSFHFCDDASDGIAFRKCARYPIPRMRFWKCHKLSLSVPPSSFVLSVLLCKLDMLFYIRKTF